MKNREREQKTGKRVRCDYCGRIYLVSAQEWSKTSENHRRMEPNFCSSKCQETSDDDARYIQERIAAGTW